MTSGGGDLRRPGLQGLRRCRRARGRGRIGHRRGRLRRRPRRRQGTRGSGAATGSAKTPGPWPRQAPQGRRRSTLRRVFVWSSAHAGAAATARAKKLDRARDDLDAPRPGPGQPPLPRRRRGHRPAGPDRRATDGSAPTCAPASAPTTTGKPTLAWHFDQAALDAEAATDGWYCLLTNLDPADADAAEVLARYKGQEVVERRYGDFKGPLAVAPMFLKNNRRIEALITVICLALLIFCLVERQVRHAIAPERDHDRLPRSPKARPTGRLIFDALSRLVLIPARATGPPVVPAPPELPPASSNCSTSTRPPLADHRRPHHDRNLTPAHVRNTGLAAGRRSGSPERMSPRRDWPGSRVSLGTGDESSRSPPTGRTPGG